MNYFFQKENNKKNKIKNVFAKSMLNNTKLTKALNDSIITQSGGVLSKTFSNMMGKIGKEALIDLAFPFAKDVLPNLATTAIFSALDKFERKISGQGASKLGKRFAFIYCK